MASESAPPVRPLRRVCVFCGSSSGNDPKYLQVAAALGPELARRGITLVYGGGSIGLMGVCSSTSTSAGGKVISVIPGPLSPKELTGPSLGYVFLTPDMHQRKDIMYHLSDAFIALPGGLGTFEEAVEATHWTNSGIHHKPVGFLNIENYFEGLLTQLDHIVESGFAPTGLRSLYCQNADPSALLDQLSVMVLADRDHPQVWTLSQVAQSAAQQVAGSGEDM